MDFKKLIKDNAVPLLLLFLLIDYCIIYFCVIDSHIAIAGLQDYGFMSVLTLIFIGSCQLMAFWNFTQASTTSDRIGSFALFIVLQVYFMREADIHHFFTEKSVDNLKFFLNPDYTIGAKFIAGSSLGIFFIAFAYIIIRYGWGTIKAFFRGESWAVAIGFWGTLLVVSQIWDRRNLPPEPWRLKMMEEYLEFSASTYLPTAMILYYIKMKKKLKK